MVLRMFTNICNTILGSFNETFLKEQVTTRIAGHTEFRENDYINSLFF